MGGERGPDFRSNLLRMKLANIGLRLSMKRDEIRQDVKYKMAVSKDRRKQVSLEAETFASEVTDFLKDSLGTKLKPLNPSKEQLMMFEFLLESIDAGRLVLESTRGDITLDGRPFVVKEYEAKTEHSKPKDLIERIHIMKTRRWVKAMFFYGVGSDFPHRLGVFGSLGEEDPNIVDFLTFPKKIETSEEAQQFLGGVDEEDFIKTVRVYKDGKRLIINVEGIDQEEQAGWTRQYYLVGSFAGEETKRSYWLYNCNHGRHDKMTILPLKRYQEEAWERLRHK